MSLIFNSPIFSLSPIYGTIYEPASILPITTQVILNNDKIIYDPFRTFNTLLPYAPSYYLTYPDLNTDIKLQKKVFNSIWNKLEDKWIYEYVKIFKYITGSKGSYKLVSSLTEAENNKFSSSDVEDKAEWFLSNVYKRSNLANTVEKYRKRSNINLWDVEKDEDTLKAFIYHQIKRQLFNDIA